MRLFPYAARLHLWLVVTASFVGGCAPSGSPVGVAKGKVTFEGKPVGPAILNFFAPENGKGASCPLDAAGEFELKDQLPVGSYRVYISTPPAVPGAVGTPPTPAPPAPEVPKRYLNQNASDLTVEILRGKNELNLDLKP